jgi:tRNA pseudouridine38-40 synthase
MVRNITGTLVAIGRGDESQDRVTAVLKSRDRTKGGAAAPPHGLTLVKVDYPDEFDLPPGPNDRS